MSGQQLESAAFVKPSVRSQLLRAGFTTVDAVASALPSRLMAACPGLTADVAAFTIEACLRSSQPMPRSRSAYDLLVDAEGSGVFATSAAGRTSRLSQLADGFSQISDGGQMSQTHGAVSLSLGDRAAAGGGGSRPRYMATFAMDLDVLLGGGARPGALQEVCGPPGAGKTQLCMQLAISVQLPTAVGGFAGRCLYVDTEGSVAPRRFRQMAAAAATQLAQLQSADAASANERMSEESFLDGVEYLRLLNAADVAAFVLALDAKLESSNKPSNAAEGQNRPIRLVVIDSIAFPFRHSTTDYSLRARTVYGLAQKLGEIARRHDVAVVVTNQLTNSSQPGAGSGSAMPGGHEGSMVPALGDAWASAVALRLLLEPRPVGQPDPSVREAILVKSPWAPKGSCFFSVTADGIRSAANATEDSLAVKRKRSEGDGLQ